jgi:hypothetical protein
MRAVFAILIFAGLGGVYLYQKTHSGSETAAAPPALTRSSAAAASSASPASTVSEHNWMKRSLDRAHEVAEKVKAKAKDDQNP